MLLRNHSKLLYFEIPNVRVEWRTECTRSYGFQFEIAVIIRSSFRVEEFQPRLYAFVWDDNLSKVSTVKTTGNPGCE